LANIGKSILGPIPMKKGMRGNSTPAKEFRKYADDIQMTCDMITYHLVAANSNTNSPEIIKRIFRRFMDKKQKFIK